MLCTLYYIQVQHWDRHYHPHFTAEKTEVYRTKETCPRSYRYSALELAVGGLTWQPVLLSTMVMITVNETVIKTTRTFSKVNNALAKKMIWKHKNKSNVYRLEIDPKMSSTVTVEQLHSKLPIQCPDAVVKLLSKQNSKSYQTFYKWNTLPLQSCENYCFWSSHWPLSAQFPTFLSHFLSAITSFKTSLVPPSQEYPRELQY